MILRTLLSHYRRHPVQALFLLTGVAVANVLLVGTQLINAQARSSYAQGEQLLAAVPVGEIQPRDAGSGLPERSYVELRRQGFHELAPLLRRVVVTADGQAVELLGIDALAMPRAEEAGAVDAAAAGTAIFSGFAFEPYQMWGAPARLEQLGWEAGREIRLSSGGRLPPVTPVPDASLGYRLLLDIGALQVLTDSAGTLSAILVFPMSPGRRAALEAALPPDLHYVPSETGPDSAELTRSFHLNLAAMGLLAFVVGIFLIYNALSFSYTDRRDLIRKLRLAGVSRAELVTGLLAELCLFLTAGALLGFWLGSMLAARLLPGVGQTLAQLYDVYIAYPDGLAPGGLWLPLLMTLAAALCVAYPLREVLAAPLLQRWSAGWTLRAGARRDTGMLATGLLLLVVAVLLGMTATHTWVALVGMACLLLGASLCLPMVVRALLALLSRAVPSRHARLTWLIADSRWLLGPGALALMALTLALVANSGLNTMIGSFRQATDDWLLQRLSADLYLRGAPSTRALREWLDREHPGVHVAERHQVSLQRPAPSGGRARVEVIDLPRESRFTAGVGLLQALPDAAEAFAAGEGVYISERAWRLDGWAPGDRVALCDDQPGVPVLGVYHDYGNPLSQWMAARPLFEACWPRQEPVGQALWAEQPRDWGVVSQALLAAFDLAPNSVVEQAELRQAGLAVFDRTFAVTRALNALTLLVAGIGIFCAVSAIHHHRAGQQSLLASLGMTRRERGVMLLAQWGLLGLLCMALVWPFGTALAAYLAGVVTPVAFGWSFALVPQWAHYPALAALAAGCLVLAVLLPSLRLLRSSPAALLREQSV